MPSFSSHRIVEIIYSELKQERAVITVDDAGIYRIIAQWWITSDWKEWQKAYWQGAESDSRTDNIVTARKLAAEALRCSKYDAG